MRDEVERLMRRVHETNAEISSLMAVGTVEAEERLDKVIWGLLDGLRTELVALQPSWPAEWRPLLTTWCESWRVCRDDSDPDSEPSGDASDWAAEEIGLLFGMPGAAELRANRDRSRAVLAQAYREYRGVARRAASDYVWAFRHATGAERERWGEKSEAGDVRRRALAHMAVETRVRCGLGDARHPLTQPLLDMADALLTLVQTIEQGLDTGPVWDRIEELTGALVRELGERTPKARRRRTEPGGADGGWDGFVS